ncbi:restriction alleviation protein, Lar family [Paraburkholderia sp. Ac-20340]|uniref:Lar family restriction alleviation protein n=1 Tax=Paraburkholderia sp. Ac-20340 TaxID=2703888 RepID=UPI00197DB905|nr:Lar family restriction alleviation protein [Paraburkholderia sp. Ac-20340]MBN3853799.1 restriction alleviation protein, Lar family [Paraburkholderia sp. Ac-20340]
MDNQLKPCPFCGGKAFFERIGTARQSCIVECASCGTRNESGEEGDACGNQWNARAVVPADAAAAPIMRFNIIGNLINPAPNGLYVRYEDHARIAATVAPAAVAPLTVAQRDSIWVAAEALEKGDQHAHASELRAMLKAAPTPTVAADAAAPINLEGLRKKLLTPREIVRDDQGFLTHPNFPICDEGTRADKFLEAFGIEPRFRSMENDLPDLHERWCEGDVDNCSEWTPTAPEGDGWLLLEIYDTEDGPYALFGRDKYEAENALKRQRMRDSIQRRQANQGDAQ